MKTETETNFDTETNYTEGEHLGMEFDTDSTPSSLETGGLLRMQLLQDKSRIAR